MKTADQVSRWCGGAAEQFGDPSVPVCQLFLRWQEVLSVPRGDDALVCGMLDGELVLLLGPEFRPFPIPLLVGDMQLDDAGDLEAFGADRIAPGVWALTPSLNAEGAIHAFIVLYDVPEPAPFERRILLPAGVTA